jgi:hypothetical protein
MSRSKSLAVVLALFGAATGAPAFAGQNDAAVDARWLPWIGCWRPADVRSPDRDVQICVVPAGASGARMLTLAGEQTVIDETFVADGVAHDAGEAGCRGTRTSEWSDGGARLFSSAELACEGQPARKVSGLSFIAVGGHWVDIQAVSTGARETVRVRRYARTAELPPDGSLLAPELAARAARSWQEVAAAALTVNDVIEMSRKISPNAIEAAIVEMQSTFPLNSRTLLALDDAGVSEGVIDLMVAQTFPRQFQIRRRGGSSSVGGTVFGGFPGSGFQDAWMGFDPYYAFYSPFGLSYWRYFDYDYGFGSSVIVVQPGGTAGPEPSAGHGRVVNGSGYTLVSPREPESSGSTRPRSSGDGTATESAGSSGGSSSGGSGGGSVSSGGYSSGGGGSDGGRSAVPRD